LEIEHVFDDACRNNLLTSWLFHASQLDVKHRFALLSRDRELSHWLNQWGKFRLLSKLHVLLNTIPADERLQELCLPIGSIAMILLFKR
jgi:hypothetical protein